MNPRVTATPGDAAYTCILIVLHISSQQVANWNSTKRNNDGQQQFQTTWPTKYMFLFWPPKSNGHVFEHNFVKKITTTTVSSGKFKEQRKNSDRQERVFPGTVGNYQSAKVCVL